MADPTPQAPVDSLEGQSLRELIRSVYQAHRSGVLEVRIAAETRRFYFVDGDLYLLDGHPLARRMALLLGSGADRATQPLDGTFGASGLPPAGEPSAGATVLALPYASQKELKELLSRIARFLGSLGQGEFRFLEGKDEIPADLVGPLPTGFLVMEVAVLDQDDASLLAWLGGLEGRLRAQPMEVHLNEVFWLDTEEAFLLTRLETPLDLGTLLSQIGVDRSVALKRIGRLFAVGLLRRAAQKQPADPLLQEELVTAAVVRRFRERIGQDLVRQPMTLTVEEHRGRLAKLIATLGELDHYQLLRLKRDASLEKVHSGYEELARLVHPSHAERLFLTGKEQALDFLFERATEAYLTLSDPKRRAYYDQRMDFSLLEESPEDEEERNRELAREYYRLARRLAETEQFHAAHELLRDATRRDPRPEYFGLLGQVQARNPNWLRRAVESYRKAVELAPNSVDLRLGLAMTCERAGYSTEAKLHYENVLARSAGDPTAKDALRRLRGVRGGGEDEGDGDGEGEKKSKRGFLSRLFARGA